MKNLRTSLLIITVTSFVIWIITSNLNMDSMEFTYGFFITGVLCLVDVILQITYNVKYEKEQKSD